LRESDIDIYENGSSHNLGFVDKVRHHTGAPVWFKLADLRKV